MSFQCIIAPFLDVCLGSGLAFVFFCTLASLTALQCRQSGEILDRTKTYIFSWWLHLLANCLERLLLGDVLHIEFSLSVSCSILSLMLNASCVLTENFRWMSVRHRRWFRGRRRANARCCNNVVSFAVGASIDDVLTYLCLLCMFPWLVTLRHEWAIQGSTAWIE